MHPPKERATVHGIHFILYVTDQDASARFYTLIMGVNPRLHVPGMTEWMLPGGAILGLMPSAGIQRLLGDALPAPTATVGALRAELYLVVDDPQGFHARALAAGAKELSALQPRSWGHDVAYSLDPDGHVLAFAHPSRANATRSIESDTVHFV